MNTPLTVLLWMLVIIVGGALLLIIGTFTTAIVLGLMDAIKERKKRSESNSR